MTPDASHPPADVRRPTPPLTEEELAHLAGKAEPYDPSKLYTLQVVQWDEEYRTDVPRLIAEIQRLRAQNAEYVAFIATVVRVPNAP